MEKLTLKIPEHIPFHWIVGGQALLVLLIVGTVSWQVSSIKAKIGEMADLKDPSPFTGHLETDMSQVNIDLLSYWQNHDAHVVNQISATQTHFENSLAKFQKANPRLLPSEAQQQILDAFAPFKDIAQLIIGLGNQQADKTARLLNDEDDIVNTFEYRLRPLVHRQKDYSSVRLDLINNMENEAQLIPEAIARQTLGHAAPGDDAKLFERRFEKFFSIYEPMVHSAAEERDLRHIRALWEDMSELVVDITNLEQSRADLFSKFTQAYQTLQNVIVTTLPAVPPEVVQEKKNAIFRGIERLLVGAAILVLAGVGFCVAFGLWMYRRLRQALTEIQVVTDAAITGDLSRQAVSSSRELGGIATSVNRLIGVLRRSEQLILQLGSIIESSGDASIGLTLDGTILSWNNGALRMYGYSLEDVKGQSIEMLFPSNQSTLFHMLAERLDQKRQISCEAIHLRKSGVPVNVRLTLSRILDTTGHPIGLSLLSRELNPAQSNAADDRSSEQSKAA